MLKQNQFCSRIWHSKEYAILTGSSVLLKQIQPIDLAIFYKYKNIFYFIKTLNTLFISFGISMQQLGNNIS